ncbi:MAG: hypothetical protein RSB55_01935 [Oscillospiraceae bacterium]
MKRYSRFTPALVLLSSAFLLGIFLGCLMAGTATGAGSDSLSLYLERYFTVVQNDSMLMPALPALVWELLRWHIVTVLLGFTALGVFGVPLLFALRGFLLTFAIASFVHTFGGGGCFLAFIVFGVSGLLAVPVLFLLGVQGWNSARVLAGGQSADSVRTVPFGRGHLVRLGICAGVLLICILLERFVVPPLLLSTARLILK